MRRRLALATVQGFGIVADVGRQLKIGGLDSGFAVARLVAHGWSQSGLFWRNYIDAEAADVFDAYLIAVAPSPERRPPDAVIVNLTSEAEVVGTLTEPFPAIADGATTRGYEVPGAFHYWEIKPAAARQGGHGVRHNDRPWYLVVHAVLEHLHRCLADGVSMPVIARIDRDPNAADGVRRDDHGNACGGLRTPWIDVPTARFIPRCSCGPGLGAMEPFETEELVRLYGDPARYRARYAARVDELIEDGWLLPEDRGTALAASDWPVDAVTFPGGPVDAVTFPGGPVDAVDQPR
jgi:hypothetical protein